MPVKTQPSKRGTIERLLAIAVEVSKQPTNQSQLARKLEVSTKTIQRDMEFMRDRLMIQMEYSANTFCWHMPAKEIPRIMAIGAVYRVMAKHIPSLKNKSAHKAL